MTDIGSFSIRNFTGVFSHSFFSVTVEDLEDAGVIGRLDVVLV